ncbi:MAG: hypothetical protein M1826_004239 [Phylliscum demangeonii]|nr:MAG: hypothetical protein M1826_004239 [Phylliscum demangeonii]
MPPTSDEVGRTPEIRGASNAAHAPIVLDVEPDDGPIVLDDELVEGRPGRRSRTLGIGSPRHGRRVCLVEATCLGDSTAGSLLPSAADRITSRQASALHSLEEDRTAAKRFQTGAQRATLPR